ncbi:MAG: hypothetical protein ALAOOOJD_02530 [bacterium]|nr:hypothetical protein [bacterium]
MERQATHFKALITTADAGEALVPLVAKILLGDLTATFLHDLNNPLTAILNYARLLQMPDFQPGEAEVFARNIVAEAERLAGLTGRIAALARPQPLEEQGAKLEEALNRALMVYETLFRHDGIIVETQSDKKLPNTQVHSAGLQQMILPLLAQARQALNGCDNASGITKSIRCVVSAGNDDKGRNTQRLSLFHNGKSPRGGTPLNLFDTLFFKAPTTAQSELMAALTHALLTQYHCNIVVESTAEGWTAIHLDLPAGS